MIRFKEYLREFRIDRLDEQERELGISHQLLLEEILKTDKFVFHINSHFPISAKMLERVHGTANEPMYAIHITDATGAPNLLRIQNTAKQISVMTDARDQVNSLASGGVATRGGVIMVVHGYPVLTSEADLWTKLDTQGRRWISLSKLYFQTSRTNNPEMHRRRLKHIMLDAHRLKFEIVEDVIDKFADKDEGVENLRLAYEEVNTNWGQKSFKEYGAVNDFKEGVVEGDETPFTIEIWKHLHYGIGSRIGRRYTAIPISKRVKGYIIRSWYDGVEKIMKQGGLEMIEDTLADVSGEEYKSWDEISMNQFEVQLMGVTNELYGENIEDLGQQNSIPVDHMYVSSKGTRFDDVIQSRVGVYYAQVRQQTPNAIRLLIESSTEMPESKNSGVAVDMMEFLLAGKVGDDAELKDILFGFAGGVYKVPYWEKGVSGTTNDWAPYVDCPVIGDSFDEGDLVNPLMYDELNVQDGAYINSHRSNGYNPANSVLVDGLAVFADLCDGRYSNYEGIAWIWFENTAMMKDRTAAGVAVGIIFGIFGKDNGWKIAQRAAEKMREHYDDFPYVPVQYLEQG
jgi:hypothetical protein